MTTTPSSASATVTPSADSTASAGPPAASSSGGGRSVQLKRVLADKPLDVQMSMLAPRPGGPADHEGAVARESSSGPEEGGDRSSAAEAAPVQRDKRGVHRAPVQAKASGDPVQRVETTPIPGGRAPAGAEVNLTGQSMSAPSADNPNFDNDAKNFETALGGAAMTRASAIATAICGKVLTYLKNKAQSTVTATEGLKTKLDALLVECGKGRDATFAGAVGENAQTIQFIASDVEERKRIVEEALAAGQSIAMYQSPPNVREQMTFLYNAGTRIIGPDLLKDGSAKVSALLGSTDSEKAALAAKEAEIRQLAAERFASDPTDGAAPTIGDAAWGVPNRPAAAPPGSPLGSSGAVTGDTTPSGGTAPVPAAADTARAVSNQGNARVNYRDVNRVTGGAHTPASTRATTALPAGAEVSERERAHMQINPGDVLKWSEGDKMWFINEKDTWVQAIRELGLPLGGGPSGTTTALMNINEMVSGASAVDARLCAIGYLLPIHAHTLVEVMAAAAAFGAPFTAGRQMYANIQPFTPDQLRDFGRTNPQASSDPQRRAKLFPHEGDPPPPAPASTGPTGPGATPGAPSPAPAAPGATGPAPATGG